MTLEERLERMPDDEVLDLICEMLDDDTLRYCESCADFVEHVPVEDGCRTTTWKCKDCGTKHAEGPKVI